MGWCVAAANGWSAEPPAVRDEDTVTKPSWANLGAAVAPETYRLFPGDLVLISVADQPDLTTQMRVPDDGGISFPLIGIIDQVKGRTIRDVRVEIGTRLLDGFLRRAEVSVSIVQPAPRPVFVTGAVGKSAAIECPPFQTITAVQAIAQAGGLAADADRGAIRIMRDDQKGGQVEVPFNDVAVLVLQPGDVILVPRLDRIHVLGKVNHAGPVELPQGQPLTLSKAISQAGGFDRFAIQERVQLLRAGEPSRSFDVEAVLNGKSVDDPLLKAGDLVFVPESRW